MAHRYKHEFCCFRCFMYFETDEDQFGRVLCPSCREVERRTPPR